MNDRIVLVTTTFIKSVDEVRAQLALKTCRTARDNDYPIIVIDGSPCEEFKQALRETGATVIDQEKPGMGQSRRECFNAGLATEAEVLVWLEPEKYTLVPLLGPCIARVMRGATDVVIPRRRNLDGYPQYQHWSELRANWELGNITKRFDIDFYIGPRIMNRQAAMIMAAYQPIHYGDNWEILFIPLLWFLTGGVAIDSVIVDYVHPVEQLIEDDESMRSKRDKQRTDIVSAMQREAVRLGLSS
ncbi:MAG TPA: hypothetical protein PLB51_00175 [Candidatus Paceibacterota bacterium]|nr:hypothetical protein [Candidatus Paceibacterota bacterium]